MSYDKWIKEKLEEAVKKSINYREIIEAMGGNPGPSTYNTLHRNIAKYNISTGHLTGCARGPSNVLTKEQFEKKLIENSTPYFNSIRKSLLTYNYFAYECNICKVIDWVGKPLKLEFDHINGLRTDNRLINLRLLCPNCHSQTETYCGRNAKYEERAKIKCIDCDKIITEGLRCKPCHGVTKINKKTKINWPTVDELNEMLKTSSYLSVGRKLGVSDNSIRKHIKQMNRLKKLTII